MPPHPSLVAEYGSGTAVTASRSRKMPRPFRTLRRSACMAFAWVVFAISIVPGVITLLQEQPDVKAETAPLLGALPDMLRALPLTGSWFGDALDWYRVEAIPVEELRALAPMPAAWQGSWYDFDKNYAGFEKWLGDHIGLRNLMIRTKNEVDYRLFRSSSRVYYGHGGELYGRNLASRELPHIELLLDTPQESERIYQGVLRYAEQLSRHGVTLILMAPTSKQYFTRERLPFFAPRVPEDSHFMGLYRRMLQTPQLHMVDTHGLTKARQHTFPVYYRQDFHWTDLTAMTVAADTVRRIAELEGSPLRWRHPLQADYQPFIGVEARFAGRLNTGVEVIEPQLKKTWTEHHTQVAYDAGKTGLEFETDLLQDAELLPPTCMYGNSFSDGMLRAGLPEHFQKFTKISRELPLRQVPTLIQGRCKYLVLQVLDSQANRWLSMSR